MDIKSISNDCIFEADFKYVYKITGQRSCEIKKMSNCGQNWVKMAKGPKKKLFFNQRPSMAEMWQTLCSSQEKCLERIFEN